MNRYPATTPHQTAHIARSHDSCARRIIACASTCKVRLRLDPVRAVTGSRSATLGMNMLGRLVVEL
jgi:hypothetical protein